MATSRKTGKGKVDRRPPRSRQEQIMDALRTAKVYHIGMVATALEKMADNAFEPWRPEGVERWEVCAEVMRFFAAGAVAFLTASYEEQATMFSRYYAWVARQELRQEVEGMAADFRAFVVKVFGCENPTPAEPEEGVA